MAKATKPAKGKAKAKPQTEPVSRLGWLPATISQAEIAELLGISTRVVRDYVSRGIIVSSPQPGRYLTQASIAGYLTSLRNKAMGRGGEDGPSLADERAKSETVNRKIAEIKLAQLQGEVLTLDVGAVVATLCANACSRIGITEQGALDDPASDAARRRGAACLGARSAVHSG